MTPTQDQTQQVQLPIASWQVIMKALLNVHAPMAETAPVYNEMVRQLAAEQAAQAKTGTRN